ncbi:MAG: hypothetical protein Ct9H90mP28_4910 [Paracoccaceae bacterium]|nr:MAG: hypothetical protein Ct9H90mP28_4910 [Paracoccaceae bacterium]
MVKLDVKVDDPERREMVKQLLTMLNTEGFKDAFLEELNDAVDIPMIGEKKEGKIFKKLYEILLKVVENKML